MARTKATARKDGSMFRRGSTHRCVIEEFWPGTDLDLDAMVVASRLGPLPGVALSNEPIDPDLLRSETFEWSHAQVAQHFASLKDPALLALVQKERLTGRALHMLLERRELLAQRNPAVPLGDLARFEEEVEKLCACDDAVVVMTCGRSLWLATGGKQSADEMLWFKHVEEKTVFNRVMISHDFNGESNIHRRHVELRFARCVGVSKTLEENVVTVAFRSSVVVMHHIAFNPETDILLEIRQCPAEAHFVEHGKKIQTIGYDMYNFTWKPNLHSLMPRQLRLALRELFLIRRFRPEHALARFDKHLLYYVFSFLTVDVLTPIPLTLDGLAAVKNARISNRRAKKIGQPKFSDEAQFEDGFAVSAFTQHVVPDIQFQFQHGVNTYDIGGEIIKFGL